MDEELRLQRIKTQDKNISAQYKKINYCLENSDNERLRITNN